MTAPSLGGERRQLTIIFSDIVGSTELASQLDPEDWHDVVAQYHKSAASVVTQFGGHVNQFLGDGILILFGYPKAQENDTERAVRAGLEIIKQVASLNTTLEKRIGKQISVRVGIHTGEVMIRQEGNAEAIFGEAPNVAARVQAEAAPGAVCISSATQKLVAGFFVVEELGPRILKGVPEPITLYKVERASGVRSRLHAISQSTLTPFVGREDERNLLMSRWSQAQKGRGQLVMVTGEAGIGKSRLLQQFKGDLGGNPHTWIEGESSPYEQDTPFAPIIDLIENAFQWTSETPLEQKIEDLERSFSAMGLDASKSVPLVANLFGLTLPPNRYPPLLLSPEQQRIHLLQTLVNWVIGGARIQPTVLVIEDLHFADPSTLEEFVLLGEQIETTPIMVIFTARPHFQPPWPTRPFHTLISLIRLDSENIREMIGGMLGNLVPNDTLESLVDRTDGNPLFAEEISQTLAGARVLNASLQQIPSSLQDLLMARLDTLGESKDVAQVGSVLGRSFQKSLLSAIANAPENKLQTSLSNLIESGLVFSEQTPHDVIYTFKHALVREAAYASMLKSRRRDLHRAVATALKEKFPDLIKQRPELTAHHLTEAGETEQAIEAWQQAGDFASARSAYAEAERHYKKALDVLAIIPDTPDRAFLELPLQVSLGNVLMISEGMGGTEAVNVFSRARDLAQQMGDSVQVQIIMLGLAGTFGSRGYVSAAQEISNELLKLAQQSENNMMLAWTYEVRGANTYAFGNFAGVSSIFDLLSQHHHPEEHTWLPYDPKVCGLIHAALAQWHLGNIEKAREMIRTQAELAKGLTPANIAMAHLGACSLYVHTHEPALILENARAMKKIAEENHLPDFRSWGLIYEGMGLILQGEHPAGIESLTQGVSGYLASGTHSSLEQYLGILAIGYAGAGDLANAFTTMDEAFGATREELMVLPELHYRRADLLVQRAQNTDLADAETSYREAISMAQNFGSVMLELRSVTHLGRLLQSCGRASEARNMLTPLYAKFTEGFDTPDLIEAKSLVDELST